MTRGRAVARLVNQVVCRARNEPWPWAAGSWAPHRAMRRELRDATAEENLTIAPSRNVVKRFCVTSAPSRPSHECSIRAARRRRQGPQARAAGRSVAKSLDEAERRCKLADVMAESAHVIIGERVMELQLRSALDCSRVRT